jgi:hypothetical protein
LIEPQIGHHFARRYDQESFKIEILWVVRSHVFSLETNASDKHAVSIFMIYAK